MHPNPSPNPKPNPKPEPKPYSVAGLPRPTPLLRPLQVTAGIVGLHLLCLAAPWTFTWPAFWFFLVSYCAVGCLGELLADGWAAWGGLPERADSLGDSLAAWPAPCPYLLPAG